MWNNCTIIGTIKHYVQSNKSRQIMLKESRQPLYAHDNAMNANHAISS